jgi:hypothetical protein
MLLWSKQSSQVDLRQKPAGGAWKFTLQIVRFQCQIAMIGKGAGNI